MFRKFVAIACLVSAAGMVALAAVFIAIIVAAGSFADQTVPIRSWQAMFTLSAGAMWILPLLVVVIGFFTLTCPQCRTSLLDPTLVQLHPPLSWLPNGRLLELSSRLMQRQDRCLKCGAPL